VLNNKIIAHLKTDPTLDPKISQAPSKFAIIFVGRKKKKSETPASRLKILLPTDVVIWSSFYLFLTGISLELKKIRSVVVVRRPYKPCGSLVGPAE
jgi:hypothetical protein